MTPGPEHSSGHFTHVQCVVYSRFVVATHACPCMAQQVTAQYIKKITADYIVMPGVSWAIMKNLGKHGTPATGMENSSS